MSNSLYVEAKMAIIKFKMTTMLSKLNNNWKVCPMY